MNDSKVFELDCWLYTKCQFIDPPTLCSKNQRHIATPSNSNDKCEATKI